MATLQHGDKVSVYYGTKALLEAYQTAADSGDIVTLNAGHFIAPDKIQKSLAIIGNGFVTDEEKGIYPTILTGQDFNFSPRDIINNDGDLIKEAVPVNGIRLEGLLIDTKYMYLKGARTLNDLQIVKCKISPWLYLDCNTKNITIRQSVITTLAYGDYLQENLYCTNSHVWYLCTSAGGRKDHTMTFDHSVIGGLMYCIANFKNCIFRDAPDSGCHVNNCIFMKKEGASYIGTGNWYSKAFAGIFEEEMSELEWDGTKTFKLKYPETYIGTDGTQVGLYGGHYPFNPTPTTPQITECQIDDATAHDGKLKVNITVKAQTED